MKVFIVVEVEGHMDEDRDCYETQDFLAVAVTKKKAKERSEQLLDEYMKDQLGPPPNGSDNEDYREDYRETRKEQKGKYRIIKTEVFS